ncbi:MAG: zinc metalloprotease HtpX [Desulfovibrio sp.]|uniref:Protease HtpX homolog n=1 Tax=Nitratidesulfovibrio liaohensis TaxID=2604158 RepID=A0ABY9R767_9BACT|nr:zinc metalloprotease HtpX [Nitratidesulfovibrio liaohensis]MDR3043233.1 zinc metalloprotease HtpX [Desulfovibrio sp.]NHZ45616.1 zinc metalloprotease HtpX [Nitratidesulfovibrio liaohensis]WMW66554.1 zinc metalloprotease HtpX [Nitratidesulfovibrio liaohensis]
MTSQIKTAMLLALLSGIIIVLGGAMGGKTGIMIALILALVMNVGSYWYSDKIVLSMYGAQEVAPQDAPMLHAMVEELAARAGIPKPRVCVIPEDAPNAFATGRDPAHGVVAVTHGIMRILSPEELKGVLAHEIGHIANRDILVQTVAGVLASVIVSIANMMQWAAIFGFGRSDDEEGGTSPLVAIMMAIVAPIAASLIQFAISRSREYLADETGASLSGNPLYLAGALAKLQAWSQKVPMQHGSQATAHMFIVNPFSGASMASLFSTHPPMEERIARLQAMAARR